MRIFSKTDRGKVRQINQDAFVACVLPDGAALAVDVNVDHVGVQSGDVLPKTVCAGFTFELLPGHHVAEDVNMGLLPSLLDCIILTHCCLLYRAPGPLRPAAPC